MGPYEAGKIPPTDLYHDILLYGRYNLFPQDLKPLKKTLQQPKYARNVAILDRSPREVRFNKLCISESVWGPRYVRSR